MSSSKSKIRGQRYKNTIGNILDYQSIVCFLQTHVFQNYSFDAFIDIPCGVGTLLNELTKLDIIDNLIGIDKSTTQLQQSIKNTKITYYQHDIFKLSNLNHSFNFTNGFCHIGFSFFNVFNEKNRKQILIELFNCNFISILGFEIQNHIFQSTYYKIDTWYESLLKDGTMLYSLSNSIDDSKVQLTLRFINKGIETSANEILYRWKLEECISDCINIGWKILCINTCDYRKIRNKIPSHYFIILTK